MHFVCHPIVTWTLLVDVKDWLDQNIVKGTTGCVCIRESEGTGGCLVAGGFGRDGVRLLPIADPAFVPGGACS